MLSAFGQFNQWGGGGGEGLFRQRGGGGLMSAVDGGCCPLSANSASGGAHVSKHRYFESMM